MLKKNEFNLIFCLSILFLVTASCFSTSRTSINGYVKSGNDQPIVNAKVTFGGPLNKSETTTDEKGFYEIIAKHRPTQMLYLTISKEGFAEHTDKFPGFGAPEDGKVIELMRTIPRRKK